jgi:glycosyltransferase involved in cell wall biosynthesis
VVHLAIIEPDAAGHHLAVHVRAIAREARARGWRLHLLTTAAALRHPAYELLRRDAGGTLATSLLPNDSAAWDPRFLRGLAAEWRRWRALRQATAATLAPLGVDVVYDTSLERMAQVVALLGSPFGRLPFVGLYTKVRFHHRRMGVRTRMGPRARLLETIVLPRVLAVPTLRALPVIDEPFADYARTRRGSAWRKVAPVPDASGLHGGVAPAAARAALGIAPAQTLVLLYGALHRRKGIAELLAALADPRMPAEVAALVAGVQDPFTERTLAAPDAVRLRAQGRLYEVPGFLDDAAEARAFAAADLVWLGYRNFNAGSAVLVQAGVVGLPCVATDRGLVGWTVERYGVGITVDTADHGAVVAGVRRLALDPQLRRECGRRGRAFAACRTPEQFGRGVCDAIAGEPPAVAPGA